MAGNFLKYGAAEATFGSRNAGDMPVDAHQLIALCAPRPTFISYGIPEKGDAKWLDQQGSYMAAVAAGPVFRLLGAKDLPANDDYRTAKMPAVNTGLLDGQLAWRQHDGGHTDGPNWKYFIPWATAQFAQTPSFTAPRADLIGPADRAAARSDRNSRLAHEQLLAKSKRGRIDLYFLGDSITRRWGATDYPDLLAHWKASFFGWNAANFGWGGDGTQNILWRLEHGELDGLKPEGDRRARGHEQRRDDGRWRGEDCGCDAWSPRHRRDLPSQGAHCDDDPHRHLSAQRRDGGDT